MNSLNGILSLLLAGSFFFSFGTVRSGVTVDGVGVGGMRYEQAETLLRERLAAASRPFTLHSPAEDAQIDYTLSVDFHSLLRRVKKGEELTAEVRRLWVTAEDDVLALCKKNSREAVDATVAFDAEGFTYTPERSGIFCDYRASLAGALAALERGEEGAELVVREYAPRVTLAMLKARTQRLSSFTTWFDGENLPRVHNIALAASRIAGRVLQSGEEFSFNEAVGKRTAENGFEEANIILDGEFVPGIGGGVCQASTTLMNAALGAGLTVTESRPHSLSVGYVPPSLDAMVSQYSDLKFVNPYEFPVYLQARTGKNYVRFTVYGLPDGKHYKTESRIRYRIAPPPAETVEGEEEKVLHAEREGISSESYLLVYDESGKLLSRKLFRKDTYAAQKGVYQVLPAPSETPPEERPSEQAPKSE